MTAPSWSPDGSWIAFQSSRTGVTKVYLVAADGTGLRDLLLPARFQQGDSGVSPRTSAWRPSPPE